MEQSNIEKAYTLINDLKMITAEILEIETFVQKAAESKDPIKICIEAFMPGSVEESVKTDRFESKLRELGHIVHVIDMRSEKKNNLQQRSHTLLTKIQDTTMYSILGIILGQRKAEQSAIIERLKQLGVIL